MCTTSFIVVNWNGKDLLEGCLNSIYRQKGNIEVILVDNGSTDASVEYVSETFPQVKLVVLGENRGFAGGNNVGYLNASGEYIALINTDVVLSDGWLEAMVSTMKQNLFVGICSSKIIRKVDGLVDSVGDYFTTAFNVCRPGENEFPEMFQDAYFVPGACAAAAMYRRRMLSEIGFFDEDFFLNHEDTDLNLRSLVSGWKTLFVPNAIAFHEVSATIGALSDTSVYYFARNGLWVWVKNIPVRLISRLLFYRVIYEIASCFVFCLVHRKWKPYLKGKIDSVTMLHKIILKRKKIQKNINIPIEELGNIYSGPGFLGHRNDVNFLFKETANGKECSYQSLCSGRRA